MFGLAGVVTALGTPLPASAQVPSPAWVKQLGSNLDELPQAVAVSGSSVYVVGNTTGQLGPEPKAGGQDVFIAKYDTAGAVQWVHQLGTSENDRATAVATDADGNVYVVGHTFGGFDFYVNAGGLDFFVTKYDAQGNQLWLNQRGTMMDDFATGVAVGTDDTLYVAGYTGGSFASGGNPNNYDVVVALYDTAGNPYWLQQYGSSVSDVAQGIAVTPSHEVYVTGHTFGSMDGTTTPVGTDIFLMRLDILGVQQWVRQVGASDQDYATSVAVSPDGGVYLAGYTFGTLDGNPQAGTYDALLARYDNQGNREWSRQFGNAEPDYAQGLAVAADGTVQVAGYTYRSLDGSPASGMSDAFLVRYDALGNKLGTRVVGTSLPDVARGVAVDANGNAYVTGYTFGALGGNTHVGGYDAFLIRF
ncbi:SBBP repeat-containing protein [Pyxidicoccus parkwayensis]|uniref:SBBP repeat-containing protein n=2 Tax=Pyxidicoccus parkwayensis TaxID=2813578 RepID=A0ABX7PCZ3_9BACT|nr:SBBP repeat-containing protein [Pyxidicoccus parkwaysis]